MADKEEEEMSLEEELGSLPDADEIERELNGTSQASEEASLAEQLAAAAQQQTPKTGPGRPQPRRGRRKTTADLNSKGNLRGGMSPTAATVGAPPSPAAEALSMDEGGDGSKSIFTTWPRILEEQRGLGYSPEALGISVARIATGPMKAPAVQMAPISGDLVAGDSTTSAAEMLYDYVVNYYHLESGGPATYRLNFFYRAGGGAIRGTAELPLQAPEQVKRQRDAAEHRRYEQAIKTGQIPPGTQFRTGFGIPFYPPGAGAQVPASTPTQPGMISKETLDEIKTLSSDAAYLRGKMEAEAQAKAQTPAPATPVRDPRLPPEGLTAEEWDRIQEERQARGVGKAVVQALTAMGFTPQTMAALHAPPQAVQPAQPTAPVTAMGALKEAISLIKEVTGFQKQIGEILPEAAGVSGGEAAKEDPDPTLMKPIPGTDMRWGEKLEDESWPEYLARWGTHNPQAAEKVLAWAAKTFDPQTFQKIATAIAEALAKRGNRGGQGGTPAAPQAGGGEAPPKLGWQPT